MRAALTGASLARPAHPGFRPALELAVALPLVPALLLVLVGFGLPLYLALTVAAQLALGALLVPDVWPGAARAQGVALLAVTAAAFWLGLLAAGPAADDAGALGGAIAVTAAAAVYVALSAVALRTLRRALLAWPLAVAVAYAVLVGVVALARPTPPPPLHAGPQVPWRSALLGGDGWEAGSALAAVGGRLVVGSPSPGYGPGFVSVVDAPGPLALDGPRAPRAGLRIVGEEGDGAGFSLAASGRDVLIGAPGSVDPSGTAAGAAYVVHVGRRHGVLRLADIAAGHGPGYRLDGAFPGDSTGYAVASPGDVNGDGIPDLAVAAPRFDAQGDPTGLGAVYVVWGMRSRRAPLDLLRIGTGAPRLGYRIVSRGGATAGLSLAPAGDVNGDGIPDVLVGAFDASPLERAGAGEAWVVFGQRRLSTVDLGSIGRPGNRQGIRILGAEAGDAAGSALAALGDVNGDGNADVAVGAPHASHGSRLDAGSAYVVYGRKAGTVDLRALPRSPGLGFRVAGAAGGQCSTGVVCGDEAGTSLAAARTPSGPVLLVGAPSASGTGRWTGAVFAVALRPPAHGGDVDLRRSGRRVEGSDPNGRTGAALAPLVRQGRLEVLVGAPAARRDDGAVYLVPFGDR